MARGATYCLALQGDTTPVEYAALKAQLTGIINELYPGAFCRLLTADAIADWTAV